ncbi:MAG: MotA/TolQ/ExbB proton channel family protein [Deltaproteobacteria bacterium]|nr:MotA/TolQ/ExbB proton channel family protein [Deltaproteobacteria bacterium]
MDTATLSGILAGFGMALAALLLGPDTATSAHLAGLMFVLGGTCAAILLTFHAADVQQAARAGIRAFTARNIPIGEAVTAMMRLAEISHKEGVMALEKIQTTNPVLQKAVRLVADSADPDVIRDTLSIEILSLRRRYRSDIAVFSRLAAYAPVMGMLGTLVGLAQMFAGLKSADALGPGMVTALMATLYGCLLSTLVFLPVAGRLKTRGRQEEYRLNIIFEGASCMLENNNPNLVHERLSSFLTPGERAGAR